MRKLLMTTAAVIAASLAVPAFAAIGIQVSGQGMLDQSRTFSVSAKINADGTATGHATLINRSYSGDSGKGPYRAQIDIQCGKRLDDGTIILGGFASKTNDSNLMDAVFFAVKDNGEPGAGRDQISRAYFWDGDPTTTGDPMACLQTDLASLGGLETIRNGNIQTNISM